MPKFQFRGTLCFPAIITISADTKGNAIVRALYGEYDEVLSQGKIRFEIDPSFEPEEMLERPTKRYRVIFKETTSYAVDFDSPLDLGQLLEHDSWREQLDNYSVSKRLNWQAENAIDVEGVILEHLEVLVRSVRRRKGE